MPQLFKSARPVRLASTTGFVVVITPEEPGLVPEACFDEAYALGCVPVDSELPVTHDAELSAEERVDELQRIIAALIAKNDPKDFTADGAPRIWAVRKLASFQVTSEEIRNTFESLSHGE